MTHPVKLCDGHTYERSAIQDWLHYNSVSPATREALVSKVLVPDAETMMFISEFKFLNLEYNQLLHDYNL